MKKKIIFNIFFLLFSHLLYAQVKDTINLNKKYFSLKINAGGGFLYFFKDSANNPHKPGFIDLGTEISYPLSKNFSAGFSYMHFNSGKFINAYTYELTSHFGGYTLVNLLTEYEQNQISFLFKYSFLKSEKIYGSLQFEPGYYFLREKLFKEQKEFFLNNKFPDSRQYKGFAIIVKTSFDYKLLTRLAVGLSPAISLQSVKGRVQPESLGYPNYYFSSFFIYYHDSYLLRYYSELPFTFKI